MVTRIPQPQFIGPAPSEVQEQSMQTGLKYADIIQQGAAEAARNYTAQQQIASQQMIANKAQSAESDRLRMTLLQKDLESKLTAAGPEGAPGVYMDNEEQFKKLFGYFANGDKDMANAMFEGAAKSINNMKATEMLQRGIIGIGGDQPAAQPTSGLGAPTGGMPGSPGNGGYTQGTSPSAPMAPVTPQVAPSVQASTANLPASAVGQPMPSATPAAAQAQPASAPAMQLPTVKTEFTPDKVKELVSDSSYMAEIRPLLAKVPGVGKDANDPKDGGLADAALLSKYPTAIGKINAGLPGIQNPPSAPSSASASGFAQTITSAASSGVPKAVLDASLSGFTKIVQAAAGEATDSVTPKEQAAIGRVVSNTVKVLKDSDSYKAFVAAGGTEEAANRAAQAVNDTIASDPNALDFFKTNNAMTKSEQASFLANVKADAQVQKIAFDQGIAQGKLENAEKLTAIKAYKDWFGVQQMAERLKIMAKNANSLDKKSGDYLAGTAWVQARTAVSSWETDYRARHPKAKDDEVNNAYADMMKVPGNPVTQAMTVAVQLMSPYMGYDPKDANTYVAVKNTFVLPNPFGEGGLIPTNEGGTVPVPGFGGNPNPNPPAAPATQAPGAQAPGPSYGSPEWLKAHGY